MSELYQAVLLGAGAQVVLAAITIASIKMELKWLWSEVHRAHRRLDYLGAAECLSEGKRVR